jgi:hypothetical protein
MTPLPNLLIFYGRLVVYRIRSKFDLTTPTHCNGINIALNCNIENFISYMLSETGEPLRLV